MDPFQEINILGIISFCNIYLVPRVSPRMTVRHAGGKKPWEQGYNLSCQGKGYTDKHYSNSSLQRCYIWQKHYLHVVQHLVFISTDDHTTIWPWFDSSSVGGTLLALVPFCQLQFFPTPTSSSFVFHGRNVTWQSSQNVNWCFGLAIED